MNRTPVATLKTAIVSLRVLEQHVGQEIGQRDAAAVPSRTPS